MQNLLDLVDAAPPTAQSTSTTQNAVPMSAWDAVFGPAMAVPQTNTQPAVQPVDLLLGSFGTGNVAASAAKPIDAFDSILQVQIGSTTANRSPPPDAVRQAPVNLPSVYLTGGTPTLKPTADVFDGIIQIPLGPSAAAAANTPASSLQERGNMRQLLEQKVATEPTSSEGTLIGQDSPNKQAPKKQKSQGKRRVQTANDLQAYMAQMVSKAEAEGKDIDTAIDTAMVRHAEFDNYSRYGMEH